MAAGSYLDKPTKDGIKSPPETDAQNTDVESEDEEVVNELPTRDFHSGSNIHY